MLLMMPCFDSSRPQRSQLSMPAPTLLKAQLKPHVSNCPSGGATMSSSATRTQTRRCCGRTLRSHAPQAPPQMASYGSQPPTTPAASAATTCRCMQSWMGVTGLLVVCPRIFSLGGAGSWGWPQWRSMCIGATGVVRRPWPDAFRRQEADGEHLIKALRLISEGNVTLNAVAGAPLCVRSVVKCMHIAPSFATMCMLAGCGLDQVLGLL